MLELPQMYEELAEKEQDGRKKREEVSKVLLELGFDLQLLGSERYVKAKLESLNNEQICRLKESFLGNKHPRFKREFAACSSQPYGKTSEYKEGIEKADSEKLARLIKIVGMLLQTKVYLFWSQPSLK